MLPSQTIDVAGQTFTPDRSPATWLKPIKPAPRRDIECLESGLPFQVSHRWFHDPNFNPCAPSSAAGGSAGSVPGFKPVESRPGARFSGFWFRGD